MVRKTQTAKQPDKKPAKGKTGRKGEETKKRKAAGREIAPEKKIRRQLTTAEWRRIRIEYVKGKVTYRELGEKWGISAGTIRKRASNEGWGKKKRKLDTEVEQKVLERVCDARAREFELIARVNDELGAVLDNMLDFVRQQPPRKYEDLRGVESLSKAIAQVVETKRNLYNVPTETDKAKIEALREKNKLEREKWQSEVAEKAASKAQAAGTVFRVIVDGDDEEGPIDE